MKTCLLRCLRLSVCRMKGSPAKVFAGDGKGTAMQGLVAAQEQVRHLEGAVLSAIVYL